MFIPGIFHMHNTKQCLIRADYYAQKSVNMCYLICNANRKIMG